MIEYPAMIQWNEEDGIYHVEFRDLPGCITFGETREEAEEMASEALTGVLAAMDSRKMKIPRPSKKKDDEVMVRPDKGVGFVVRLKMLREEKGLTQEQVAKLLNITYQTYQKIENPDKSNPTLKTILKLEKVFDDEIVRV
ncbi:MAG: helix-turn-helix domain-containing protein [Spirochaetia bacterium]